MPDTVLPQLPGAAGEVQQPTPIGRIVAVSGSQVVMLLRSEEPGDEGSAEKLQIGALVKVPSATSAVYGLVSGLSIPIPAVRNEPEHRIVELELVGEAVPEGAEGRPVFRRGVSVFPGLGDRVLPAGKEDLQLVYTRTGVATVRIGAIYQDRSLPAALVIDDLLGKHFAVVGTTGSGKSCAVALILGAILRQVGNGHIVLLDIHNEYARAFGPAAERLDTETLELPYWLLTFEEIAEIVAGSRDDRYEEDVAVLAEVVLAAKRRYAGQGEGGGGEPISVDTPVPYRLGDVNRMLDEAMGKLDKAGDSAPYLRLKARLAALQSDRRYGFMFPSGLSVRDNMAAILSRLFRIPADGKPMSIIDLSGVPSEVLNVVVSVLCRLTFDFALWNARTVPIVLVCEEAHRYAPRDDKLGFEPAKRALSRIAKEGRKYGVSLCVVSQRPSELEVDMLSQCNTVFALRLSSRHDQDFVRGTLTESAMGLLDFLPSLRDAEALVVGEGVPLPQRICFDSLPEEARPSRGTTSFSAAWQGDGDGIDMVREAVDRWRRQHR
jgi:DNA helicase HerA-like ATPase